MTGRERDRIVTFLRRLRERRTLRRLMLELGSATAPARRVRVDQLPRRSPIRL